MKQYIFNNLMAITILLMKQFSTNRIPAQNSFQADKMLYSFFCSVIATGFSMVKLQIRHIRPTKNFIAKTRFTAYTEVNRPDFLLNSLVSATETASLHKTLRSDEPYSLKLFHHGLRVIFPTYHHKIRLLFLTTHTTTPFSSPRLRMALGTCIF